MNRKAKGINAERELTHLFWERGWFPIRVAGSGSSKYPCPDIVAGNGIRRLAIECKSSSDEKRYITKDQIDDLAAFARMFNAEPWVGFRHNADWFFLALDELKDSGKSLMVSFDIARNKGLSINELAGNKTSNN
ncbi:Holliday junction resolvase [Candidatus Woesearchaeota archaeon]|nr:Holliday junction resolvase [Candidatus Woesearchaeota archaeon]